MPYRPVNEVTENGCRIATIRPHRDSWRVGWTISVWENKERMLEYRNHGNHVKAMRISHRIGDEVEAVHWEAETIPSWEEAKIRLHQKYGRKLVHDKR